MEFARAHQTLTDEAEAPLGLDGVYRAHAADVARWAAHLGGPSVDVEDVVQEVFIVVRAQLSQFRGEAKLTTWLYRITENVVRQGRRKERIRSWLRRTRRTDVEHGLTRTEPDPARSLEREQARVTVYAILDRLPEKYRNVLVLFELEGMSGEDIATLTGTKLATVWVHLHRARTQFLGEMKRQEKGRP